MAMRTKRVTPKQIEAVIVNFEYEVINRLKDLTKRSLTSTEMSAYSDVVEASYELRDKLMALYKIAKERQDDG